MSRCVAVCRGVMNLVSIGFGSILTMSDVFVDTRPERRPEESRDMRSNRSNNVRAWSVAVMLVCSCGRETDPMKRQLPPPQSRPDGISEHVQSLPATIAPNMPNMNVQSDTAASQPAASAPADQPSAMTPPPAAGTPPADASQQPAENPTSVAPIPGGQAPDGSVAPPSAATRRAMEGSNPTSQDPDERGRWRGAGTTPEDHPDAQLPSERLENPNPAFPPPR